MKEWFSNGYILKILGALILLSNWFSIVFVDIYRLVIQNQPLEPMLVSWTFLSFTPVLTIFGWHIGLLNIGNTSVPAIEEKKSDNLDTSKIPTNN